MQDMFPWAPHLKGEQATVLDESDALFVLVLDVAAVSVEDGTAATADDLCNTQHGPVRLSYRRNYLLSYSYSVTANNVFFPLWGM